MAKKSKPTKTKSGKRSKAKGTTNTKAGVGAKKKVAAKPLRTVDAMTPVEQRAVFAALDAALAKQRVKGVLAAVHFETDVLGLQCPIGTVRRMVCRKVNGVVNCAPECVTP
jgi:hypothetical protein